MAIEVASEGDLKGKFIEILARGEEEDDSLHTADYIYTTSVLSTSTDATAVKLACQAIDKVLYLKKKSYVSKSTISVLIEITAESFRR